MTRSRAAISVLLLLAGAPAQTQQWPTFRGPSGSGVADAHPCRPCGHERDGTLLWTQGTARARGQCSGMNAYTSRLRAQQHVFAVR
jgi:hypothetical protein